MGVGESVSVDVGRLLRFGSSMLVTKTQDSWCFFIDVHIFLSSYRFFLFLYKKNPGVG
jgi:hypothetical protein